MIKIEFKLTLEQIADNAKKLESEINGQTNQIKKKLTEYGDLHKDSSCQRSIDAIYNGFSVLDILWNSLVKNMRVDCEVGIICAAYIGADYGLEKLCVRHEGNQKSLTQNIFIEERLDFTETYPFPKSNLLKIYSRALDKYSKMGLAELTEQYFIWLKDKAYRESKAYPQHENLISSIRGMIGEEYKFSGLSAKVVRTTTNNSRYRWENFGGYHETVEYFKSLILRIENFDYCKSLEILPAGKILPKGILLIGPPGTGKTTLAMTFCNEAKIPYEEISISDIGSSLVNESANNLQRKFDEAASYIKRKESQFSVLFIDELDAMAKKRSTHVNGHNEDDKVVTVLNDNMSGYKTVDGVIVLGATNVPEVLDNAVTRAGRFGVWKNMGYPTKDELGEIFKIYLGNQKGIDNVSTDRIISQYHQLEWTGAIVEEVITRAKTDRLTDHLKSNRKTDYRINTDDVFEAIADYMNERGIQR